MTVATVAEQLGTEQPLPWWGYLLLVVLFAVRFVCCKRDP